MFEFLDDLMIFLIKVALFCCVVFGITAIIFVLPNWWVATVLIVFPTAYLLDKYWWQNTEMYRSKMDKLVKEMKKNRQI
ncbi:TPA: hypothetical protein ACU21O_000700 [Mannheimia haemolytica]